MKFMGFGRLFRNYARNPKILITNLIITAIRNFIIAMIVWLSFLSISPNLDLGVFFVFVITSTISVISMMPVTISGLGLRESLAVLFYGAIYIRTDIIVSAYLFLLILKYVIASVSFLVYKKH